MQLELEKTKPMKKTLGRQKITMKKIEKQSSLQVTFTKRRQGLFRKASELAILCGAEVGIIVQSPADKVYTFEEPSLETLINSISSESDPKSCHYYEEDTSGRLWWDDPIEDLELDQLENYFAALRFLGDNVAKKLTMME